MDTFVLVEAVSGEVQGYWYAQTGTFRIWFPDRETAIRNTRNAIVRWP